MPMLRCTCCGEFQLPGAKRCSGCGSERLELEVAAQNRRLERTILIDLIIAGIGSIATLIGHSMLHSPDAPHTWACGFLIGGIGAVTFAGMLIAFLVISEGERKHPR